MKTALITGITGQDGSFLAELLLQKGYDVHGTIRRSSTDYRERIAHLEGHPNFHLHYADLGDSMSILQVVRKIEPNEIYNLAAQSHVQVSFDAPEFTADVDATGVLRILEAVRQCGLTETCRIYQASTSELYGKVEEVPQNENTPFHPYSPYAVAEYAVALMLALNRKIHRAYWRTRDGNFSLHGLMGFDMYGKTAGIVGTGRIARELIRILKGFGMEVVANDLFPDPQYAAEAGIAYVPLDELYARADIVSLHCPLTDRTRYMIGDAAISRMKPGVILINTGRGQLIHTEALIDGLKEKKIGAAGLDVYEEEAGYFYEDTSDRIMDDDVLARLLSFNNVIVTSHQGFFTREAVDNIARTTMQNIKDFSECRRLENEVRAEPENAVGQL